MTARPKRRGRGAPPTKMRTTDYSTLRNPFPPMNVFSDDRVAAIHDAALDVLERLGIKVLHPGARATFKTAEEADIALDALAEVQPGGHFFGADHTMARYQTEFYEPLVADFANIGTWQERGSIDATTRATDVWKGILRDFVPPKRNEDRL